MSEAILRLYSKNRSEKIRTDFLGQVFLAHGALAIIFSLFWFALVPLFQEQYLSNVPPAVLVLIPLVGLSEALAQSVHVHFHARGSYETANRRILIKQIVFVAATAIGLLWLQIGLSEILTLHLLANLIYLLYNSRLLRLRIRLRFRWQLMKILLGYALPFIGTTLAMQTLFFADHLIIQQFLGLESVAVYALAYKLGAAIQYLSSGFSLAWYPLVYTRQFSGLKEMLHRNLRRYILVAGSLGLILTILNFTLLPYLLPPAYAFVPRLIPWILWGYFIFSLFDFLGIGLLIRMKSRWLAGISTIVAIFNLLANLYFVPQGGIMAAAVITFISFGFYLLFTWKVSEHLLSGQ
jgi:O-antigen/teichoic acid export membrane protein